jgi:hypothetical protein
MKVDPVALCSAGVYSEVYGVGEEGNIANLFASLGMIEDAPLGVITAIARGLNRLGLGTVLD